MTPVGIKVPSSIARIRFLRHDPLRENIYA
jgi:hypothetical protein